MSKHLSMVHVLPTHSLRISEPVRVDRPVAAPRRDGTLLASFLGAISGGRWGAPSSPVADHLGRLAAKPDLQRALDRIGGVTLAIAKKGSVSRTLRVGATGVTLQTHARTFRFDWSPWNLLINSPSFLPNGRSQDRSQVRSLKWEGSIAQVLLAHFPDLTIEEIDRTVRQSLR